MRLTPPPLTKTKPTGLTVVFKTSTGARPASTTPTSGATAAVACGHQPSRHKAPPLVKRMDSPSPTQRCRTSYPAPSTPCRGISPRIQRVATCPINSADIAAATSAPEPTRSEPTAEDSPDSSRQPSIPTKDLPRIQAMRES